MCEHGETLAAGSKQTPMSLVRQEDDWGCGIAVLAMLTDRSYIEAKALVMADPRRAGHDWSLHGLYWTDIDRHLIDEGWWMQRWYSGWNLPVWPPTPFADRHFAQVRQPSGNSHFVAVTANGVALDPLVNEPRRLSDWLQVDNVTGLARRATRRCTETPTPW